jgi:hypothetical protein
VAESDTAFCMSTLPTVTVPETTRPAETVSPVHGLVPVTVVESVNAPPGRLAWKIQVKEVAAPGFRFMGSAGVGPNTWTAVAGPLNRKAATLMSLTTTPPLFVTVRVSRKSSPEHTVLESTASEACNLVEPHATVPIRLVAQGAAGGMYPADDKAYRTPWPSLLPQVPGSA